MITRICQISTLGIRTLSCNWTIPAFTEGACLWAPGVTAGDLEVEKNCPAPEEAWTGRFGIPEDVERVVPNSKQQVSSMERRWVASLTWQDLKHDKKTEKNKYNLFS